MFVALTIKVKCSINTPRVHFIPFSYLFIYLFIYDDHPFLFFTVLIKFRIHLRSRLHMAGNLSVLQRRVSEYKVAHQIRHVETSAHV